MTDSFTEAFDRTVNAVPRAPDDAALIMAGRQIALTVDAARASGDQAEITKAMYLVPHMVNVLRELRATPASRKGGDKAPRESALAKLRAVDNERGGKRVG